MVAHRLRAEPAIHWDRLLFCAKEAVYMAWYPLTERWLGFEDARLSFDSHAGMLVTRPRIPADRIDGGPRLKEMHGAFWSREG